MRLDPPCFAKAGLKRVICYVEKVSNLNSFFRRSKRPAFEADYILHFILCLYCLEGGFILSCINTYRSHANLADKESPKTNKFFEGLEGLPHYFLIWKEAQ